MLYLSTYQFFEQRRAKRTTQLGSTSKDAVLSKNGQGPLDIASLHAVLRLGCRRFIPADGGKHLQVKAEIKEEDGDFEQEGIGADSPYHGGPQLYRT